MSKSNENLHRAKRQRNDEFYTRLSDIQDELDHYDDFLAGSSVYLPCDDDGSNFWVYFIDNFDRLSLSHLTATRYAPDGQAFRLDTSDGVTIHVSPLAGNGDFLGDECKAIMAESDVVITNPPFSLLREFITTLMEMGKDFITLAPMNAITYKCIFPHIKHGRIRLGHAGIKAMKFDTPDGSEKSIAVIWLTSYPIIRECKKLKLTQRYDPERYPTYDNYDAIEVGKTSEIPVDYYGVMGVPISFLNKYCPEQFRIVGISKRGPGDPSLRTRIYTKDDYPNYSDLNASSALWKEGKLKNTYPRILIQRVDYEGVMGVPITFLSY